MTTDKRSVIEDINFGGRTAEMESKKLSHYFVETEQWRKVWEDEVDIVFAPKGGGKSAIYSMLVSRDGELFDRGIVLVPGENPTGATAFEPIQSSPPTSEDEFIRIWRLYFLVLLVDELVNYDVRSPKLQEVRDALASVGLTEGSKQKRRLIVRVRDALKNFFSPNALETGLSFDPITGAPTKISARVTFNEPTVEEEREGILSVDSLYELVDEVLKGEDLRVWLILDRLDVAFAASPELEASALRALFRVYRLIEPLEQIRLKIFLRSDIWAEITSGGFRETSHFTRDMTIEWSKPGLLKLIVQRLVQSEALVKDLDIDPSAVVASSQEQQRIFDKVFPAQVDAGSRKPATFDWALSRTQDGKEVVAPRELIHLFNTVRDRQLDRIDTGQSSAAGLPLFEAQAFRDAHPEVSETRLQKTIYPEFPWLKDWLEALRGQRTLQDVVSLQELWGVDRGEVESRIRRLLDVGFFEERGSAVQRTYWVPFLYRPALELVQGAADGLRDRAGLQPDEDE